MLSNTPPKSIGVIMTCCNRERQLSKTLASIASTHENYRTVVVHDGCESPLLSPDVDTIWTLAKDKTWVNPVIAYNKAIHYLLSNHSPDIIIFQNAECYHVGDIISHSKSITDENYISFGCFSVSEPDTHRDLQTVITKSNKPATIKGDSAWYNHPIYRPVAYDFCCAISTDNMVKLNGFDERFKDDLGSADRDFIRRVRLLGLNISITAPPAPFVVHQHHERGNRRSPVQLKNNAVYDSIKNNNVYRATHLITEDFNR